MKSENRIFFIYISLISDNQFRAHLSLSSDRSASRIKKGEFFRSHTRTHKYSKWELKKKTDDVMVTSLFGIKWEPIYRPSWRNPKVRDSAEPFNLYNNRFANVKCQSRFFPPYNTFQSINYFYLFRLIARGRNKIINKKDIIIRLFSSGNYFRLRFFSSSDFKIDWSSFNSFLSRARIPSEDDSLSSYFMERSNWRA